MMLSKNLKPPILLLVFLFGKFCSKKETTTVYSNVVQKHVELVNKKKIVIDESRYLMGELHWNGFVDRQRNLY